MTTAARRPARAVAEVLATVLSAVAVTLIGPVDTAMDRAPYGLMGGASYAFGGLVAWAIRRWRAR